MARMLTQAQRDRYFRNGFVAPISVMSLEHAGTHRRALEAAEARFGPMHYVTKPHLLLLLADELVHHNAILDAVEDIIGPNILLWDSTFIIKEPGDRKYVSWHQDSPTGGWTARRWSRSDRLCPQLRWRAAACA